MDNNESGGVYAAEKIIKKRFKKVTKIHVTRINNNRSFDNLFMFSMCPFCPFTYI